MKKILTLILMIAAIIVPINTFASENDVVYATLNLDEALTQENIEHDFSSYSENDDQAIIYMFRGNGCSYCRSFLTFLNSIVDEYGKYFKVVTYETWYDNNNSNLLTEVSSFLNQPANGVPYIIIGDKVFAGYASDYDESIKTAIMEQYDSKNSYDVFKEMAKESNNDDTVQSTSSSSVIIWNFVFTAVATGTIILFINNQNKKINERLSTLEEKQTNKKKDK